MLLNPSPTVRQSSNKIDVLWSYHSVLQLPFVFQRKLLQCLDRVYLIEHIAPLAQIVGTMSSSQKSYTTEGNKWYTLVSTNSAVNSHSCVYLLFANSHEFGWKDAFFLSVFQPFLFGQWQWRHSGEPTEVISISNRTIALTVSLVALGSLQG